MSRQSFLESELGRYGLPNIFEGSLVDALTASAGALRAEGVSYSAGVRLAAALALRLGQAEAGDVKDSMPGVWEFDRVYGAYFEIGPRDMWAALSGRGEDGRAVRRHAEMLAAEDFWASALKELRRARALGVKGLKEAINHAKLMCGLLNEADRQRFFAGAAGCGCEGWEGKTRPKSQYLKEFYTFRDDCYDLERWLCLRCGRIFKRVEYEDVNEWWEITLESIQSAGMWDVGWGGQFPGAEVVASRESLMAWVGGLKSTVYAASLP